MPAPPAANPAPQTSTDEMSEEREAGGATVELNLGAETRDLIDAAAAAGGRTRAAFITEAARRAAQNALLDQVSFVLPPDEFDAFVALLDAPPADDEKVRKLMTTPPPWAKSPAATPPEADDETAEPEAAPGE